jgi:hypothetical protein
MTKRTKEVNGATGNALLLYYLYVFTFAFAWMFLDQVWWLMLLPPVLFVGFMVCRPNPEYWDDREFSQ